MRIVDWNINRRLPPWDYLINELDADVALMTELNKELLEFAEMEKSIVQKELRRHDEMARISLNPEYGQNEIKKIKEIYDIDGDQS